MPESCGPRVTGANPADHEHEAKMNELQRTFATGSKPCHV
jgi:hypothetical protein